MTGAAAELVDLVAPTGVSLLAFPSPKLGECAAIVQKLASSLGLDLRLEVVRGSFHRMLVNSSVCFLSPFSQEPFLPRY